MKRFSKPVTLRNIVVPKAKLEDRKAIGERERYSLIPWFPFRIKEQIMHFLRTNTLSLSLDDL
jgi:hypothetical protein